MKKYYKATVVKTDQYDERIGKQISRINRELIFSDDNGIETRTQ